MKFKIHFSVYSSRADDWYDDSLIVTGDTIEEIKEKTKSEMDSRGIKENNWWSEEVN